MSVAIKSTPGSSSRRRLWGLAQGLLTLALTLFGLLLITFLLSALSPVDRVLQIVGDHASAATYEQVKQQLGLDRSLSVQFWHYLERLAHGDLGTASATGQPVLLDLLHAFPATLELATLSLVIGARSACWQASCVRVLPAASWISAYVLLPCSVTRYPSSGWGC
ncbi:Probable D,D-dipeptide transport system permease protein ddpB [Serratia fonticola]|uniref:Probable D,D-dipeptide transport system permease protein ddpB n=1 Tax=Serratia fonticola TaxID=47917 RepID=A0A4U9TWF5_SERFO|nr:Probable D,D-dipeptide transport system permease protein ddpB [Serratia fonticola]